MDGRLCHFLLCKRTCFKIVSTFVLRSVGMLLTAHANIVVQGGMELRVLHASAHRGTWYGRWGYGFGRGGFNMSRTTWRKAAELVAAAPLASVAADLRTCSNMHASAIIDHYRVRAVLPAGEPMTLLADRAPKIQRLEGLLLRNEPASLIVLCASRW